MQKMLLDSILSYRKISSQKLRPGFFFNRQPGKLKKKTLAGKIQGERPRGAKFYLGAYNAKRACLWIPIPISRW